MSKRYETGAAEETQVEVVGPADAPELWDDDAPPHGARALVIGNPWASAYAVLGDTDTLGRFAARLARHIYGSDPDALIDWTRRAYLDALRAAGRGDAADLLAGLHPRVDEPEPAEGETGPDRVVDLDGVSVCAVPTDRGLRIHLDSGDLLDTRARLHGEIVKTCG